jgi:two-component system sensor histidine kinase GlrK
VTKLPFVGAQSKLCAEDNGAYSGCFFAGRFGLSVLADETRVGMSANADRARSRTACWVDSCRSVLRCAVVKVARSIRLWTRLGISHGVIVALLVIVLGVTLQGLLRMLSLVVEIRDRRLSSVDAEEEVHRAAWKIEVAMRHGRAHCAKSPVAAALAGEAIVRTRGELREVLQRREDEAPASLQSAAEQYAALADVALGGQTCAFLLSSDTDAQRAKLEEDLTEAWIDRLQELHADIRNLEDRARYIGKTTALVGASVAVFAAAVAVLIARSTSRSVAGPITRLGAMARRLGDGDFAPSEAVAGPCEVEALWRDLERSRERLLELDELKQNFLASISHELRSPLTSVREALGLLADGTCGAINGKQSRVVLLAQRACEREVRIVEALLDLSRFRSGMPLKFEAACDICEVVEAAVGAERDEADRRGIAIDIRREPALPLTEMDSALVERAVANLLRNAVSVSHAGMSVYVHVHGVVSEGQTCIAVDVGDEGPGLPEGLRTLLFRPFATAPVISVGRPAGIGLGLAFAREVARAHAGDVTVVQSDAQGSLFRLSLGAGTRRG